MTTVFVQSCDGKALMPTTRCGHVRWLLKNGKARVVETKPFTIRLNYETDNGVQDVILGIDEGRTNIGASAIKADGTPLMTLHLDTRNKDIPKLMESRKQTRRKHRVCGRRDVRQRRAVSNGTQVTSGKVIRLLPGCEKSITCTSIKNKKVRFSNRVKPKGWLTPTANQLLNTHINLVKKIREYVPVSKVAVELNKFSFMELDNPHIQKWQYSKGALYGKGSLTDAVYMQQDGKCILCGEQIEHYHHVVPKSKRGSNTIKNVVGLCSSCHEKVHKDSKVQSKLQKEKTGLNKKYRALSVLNQTNNALFEELEQMFPNNVYASDGRNTKLYREDHSLDKDHTVDAYCIAASILPKDTPCVTPTTVFEIKQFRRHDRQCCHQERVNRNYMLGKKIVATNRHKAIEQKSDSLEEYVANGGRTDNLTVKKHPAVYKRLDRIMPGAMFLVNNEVKILKGSTGLHNGKPDYYVFTDGTKTNPKYCHLLKCNTGLVFV